VGLVALVALMTLVAAACGGEGDQGSGPAVDGAAATASFTDPVTVVVANSPGTLTTAGTQRVMTALIGEGPNAYLGGPDQPVVVRFSSVDGEAGGEVAGEWLTTSASALGLYIAPFAFTEAGPWTVTVSSSDGRSLGETVIEVVDVSAVPTIGDPAPPSSTPTAADPGAIAAISTDPDPDLGLYDLSIAEAVGNGRPTVVAFATPAFCQTALCGPTLDFVKAATRGRDGVDVVHVEPFDVERARAGSLEPIPAMSDWGLVTEPWVFVVDADGRVAASFEGIIGQEELERALDRL
jgi:hypothetical protein